MCSDVEAVVVLAALTVLGDVAAVVVLTAVLWVLAAAVTVVVRRCRLRRRDYRPAERDRVIPRDRIRSGS